MKTTSFLSRLVIAAMCALPLVSCGEKPDPTPEPEPTPAADITLTDEKDANPTFDAKGGTQTISFTATADWKAQLVNSAASDWVTVSPTSGTAGSNSVSITLKENEGNDDRSTSVKITCGSKSKQINITQKQRNALTVTTSTFEVGAEGGKINIVVKSNISHTVTIDGKCSDWVKEDAGTKAISSKAYNFVVSPNDGQAKREGEIIVAGEGLTETVHIYQAGTKPSIVLTKNEYVLSGEAATISVEVSHNVDVTCVMPEGAAWLTKVDTKAMSTSKFSFNVAENATSENREAEIKFVNTENGLSESVKVFQKFIGALVVAKNEYEVGWLGGTVSVTVGHNVDIDVTCTDWINLDNTKAYTEETLNFTIKRYNNSEKRTGSIVFTSADKSLKQEVKVTQEGADWNDIPTDEMWYKTSDGKKLVLTGKGPLFDVDVTSNTFEDGVGILKLSGAPTRIKNTGFMNNVEDMSVLTGIALPSSLRVIEENAFYNMRGITDLVIPEGVEEIQDGACKQMSALETITLPSTLKTIGYSVFFVSPVKRFLGPCDAIIMDGMAVTRNQSFTDQVSGIDYTGKWISKASSEIVDANIPDGIVAIDNGAFRESTILETMTIPSSLKRVGSDNFRSEKFRYIGGPYASADNRCYISYGELQVFAPAGLKSYTTPSSVTSIGATAFQGCKELEELVINDEVTTIGMYAFSDCPKLKSITLPAKLEKMSYDPFMNDTALESIYVRSLVPPSTNITYTVDFPNLKIYVPDSAVELYNNSDSWSQYRKYLTSHHYEGLENPDYYVSTDFSAKGRVTRLQTASEGNGINIVLMGDAFSDRQIADGTYGDWMKKAMESFFAVEPYKTYRNLFNVYSVDVVSNSEGFDHSAGALGTYFGSGTFVNGDVPTIKKYAFMAVDESKADDLTIIVVPNKDAYAGTCNMIKPASAGGYAQGLSVSWIPASSNYETFSTTLNHEVGGHGFGKLIDEYYYAGTTPTQDDIDGFSEDKARYNWYLNFDFTASSDDVSWSGFIKDSRYAGEGLGVFEGAYYQYKAYRPRESSIMRYNVGGYNAPSREIIYKRIMSLAYGASWTYSYEDFVRYDSKNIPAATKSAGYEKRVPAPFVSEQDFIPLARPVVTER